MQILHHLLLCSCMYVCLLNVPLLKVKWVFWNSSMRVWVSNVKYDNQLFLVQWVNQFFFIWQLGGWGKPPVDETGKPLYGDVFGQNADAAPEPVCTLFCFWYSLIIKLHTLIGPSLQPLQVLYHSPVHTTTGFVAVAVWTGLIISCLLPKII